MKEEYIIINKTTLEEKIKELEGYKDEPETTQLLLLQQILLNSADLLTEIEKAFDAGRALSNKSQLYTPDFYWTKQDYIKTYIENLNL